jgi:predicted permease
MLDAVRDALRGFRHRRGLAVTIVTTLALGIGANAAIFSMVDAVLLRPLPYPSGERLVAVYELNRAMKQATQLVAPVRLEEWNRANRSFDGLAGSYFENVTDTTMAEPQRVEAMRVSPRFFAVLGVDAALGRTLAPPEEVFGGPPAVVISDAFWRTRFNGDRSVVGRTLVLNGVSRAIVGVMPPSFRYPAPTTEMWIPAQMAGGLLRERRARFYTAIGRLKAGVTLEQAEGDLAAIQSRLASDFPDTDKGWSASLVPLRDEQVGAVRGSLWLLFGAVGLLLAAACGNVACLMLADAARREHETAVRFALGASRSVVIRQLLVEGLALAAAGAGLGLAAARWAVGWLRAAVDLPLVAGISIDGRVLLFTAGAAIVTTVIFGLAPAVAASAIGPSGALSRGGRGQIVGRQLAQRVVVAGQVALAIVLLTAAGLLVRSFVRLQHVPLGFDPNRVIAFRVSASWAESRDGVSRRQARTIARLEAIPGVEAAAVSQAMPAGVSFPPGEFAIVGRDSTQKLFAHGRSVSSGYFRALHIPMLQGDTCSADPAAPGVKALVTKAFAAQFFQGENALGHYLAAPGFPAGTRVEIVGVVGDVREGGALHDAEPLIYWCGYLQYWPDPHFLVRFDPAQPVSIGAIRAALLEIEPKRAVYAAGPLTDSLAAAIAQQRLSATLVGLFAATTLLLAALGLFGVLSQLVTARRREIGVRMALGARTTQILAAVGRQAATLLGAGLAIGLTAAFALGRFMTSLVFGVTPYDPVTFTAAPILLAVVAAIATYVPARRAAAVDPMQALRHE